MTDSRSRRRRHALLALLAATLVATSGTAAVAAEVGAGDPTIQVTPTSLNLACTGSFEIVVRNSSVADEDLAISSITLHNAYSQGDYGTGFSWDTSGFTLPLTLGRGESVTIPISYSAAGQRFNSRLVLTVTSNASNNDATQYIAYHGTLCATETPTRPVTSTTTPTATPTPQSTATSTSPVFDCPLAISLTPDSGPPGTQVHLVGKCYFIHSGRSAGVYFDGVSVGQVRGETSGDYSTDISIPAGTVPGSHLVRVSQDGGRTPLGEAVFDVTGTDGPCPGDCDGNNHVTLNEMVTGIRIVLGAIPPSQCPNLARGGGIPNIANLLSAVRSLLDGC